MRCVKDGAVCEQRELERVTIDVCPMCHGVWLDGGEMKKLVSRLTIQSEEKLDEILERWEKLNGAGRTPPNDFWREDHLICPNEVVQLQKHYFAGTTIGIDHCFVCHGFWIDGPELAAIAEEVGPNPLQDALGRYMIQESNRMRRRAEELKMLPNKVFSILGSLFTNPPMFLLLVGSMVMQSVVDDLERMSAE